MNRELAQQQLLGPIRPLNSLRLKKGLGQCRASVSEGRNFDPEHVKAMGKASDSIIRELHDSGQSRVVREVIAERIIAIANSGERDPDKLCELAMDALGVKRSA